MDIVRHFQRIDTDGSADWQIGLHVDAFKQYLSQHRYAAKTAATYLRCITHFAQWTHTGHESPATTHRHVEADLAMKEKALARLEAPDTRIRRHQAPDSLIRFLQTL